MRTWPQLLYLCLVAALIAATTALVAGCGSSTRTVTVGGPHPSTAAGAAGVVAINPKAEAARADAGGARPKGLPLGSSSCGVERAAVKHLTDGFTLPAQPTLMTIDQLVGMAAPPVTPNSPRLPEEKTLVELQNVHVIAVKQEGDSDLHIIVATPTGAEMNVESPAAACDSSSPYATQLAQARAAADQAMPNVSSSGYTPENLTATIEGVLFWDVLHGQRGAPTGVELHPLTYFSTSSGPPPPVTTTTPTDTTPTTTAPTTTVVTMPLPVPYSPRWRGCRRYPHRIFYHHRPHRYCRRYYFTTP